MSYLDSMFDVKPVATQPGAAASRSNGNSSRVIKLERKIIPVSTVRITPVRLMARTFHPSYPPVTEPATEPFVDEPDDAPEAPDEMPDIRSIGTTGETGSDADMVFYTVSSTGLEGHSFLPSRDELIAELLAIEDHDIAIEIERARRDQEAAELREQEMARRALIEEEQRRAEAAAAAVKPRPVLRIREHINEPRHTAPVKMPRETASRIENVRQTLEYAPPQRSHAMPVKRPAARPVAKSEPVRYRMPQEPAESRKENHQARTEKALPKKMNVRMPRMTMPRLPKVRMTKTAFRSGVFLLALSMVAGGGFYGKQFLANSQKGLFADGRAAYEAMLGGIDAALEQNFALSEERFALAHKTLKNIGGKARPAARGLAAIADTLSFSSETISGVHVLEAAEQFAEAGQDMAAYAALFSKNGVGSLTPKELITGYLTHDDLKEAKSLLSSAIGHLDVAQDELLLVETDKLPEEFAASVKSLQEKVPQALTAAKEFASHQDSLFRALGYLGPRKYLVIFQNNAELRATGGFIGSYALLDVLDGKITRLFIDDVFNIDGQLIEKVIPPVPVQKISTAWSLHDSNWFFDFPTSAKKIAWFYEKTGGATIDGVIAINPAVLERLLAITGPLSLPNYNLTLTRENFRDELSYMVEEGLPKKEGESSKIVLRDIGTMLFEKLGTSWKENGASAFISILQESLEKRDLTGWVREAEIENFLVKAEWGGATRIADGDYLAVVHSNINGYKTDRVVSDEISHAATVAEDGSVVDTVTITRTHHGSPNSRYNALYQKVNADYLRVYVPKGSHLIEAEGYTPERNEPPIDYAEQNFKIDREVEEIENTMREHFPSNTQIYDEAGKTVFGNWVYVSPGEKVTVRYTYKLPRKIVTDTEAGTYRMLVQKQAGLEHATFNASVEVKGGKQTTGDTPPKNLAFEKDIEYAVEIR